MLVSHMLYSSTRDVVLDVIGSEALSVVGDTKSEVFMLLLPVLPFLPSCLLASVDIMTHVGNSRMSSGVT